MNCMKRELPCSTLCDALELSDGAIRGIYDIRDRAANMLYALQATTTVLIPGLFDLNLAILEVNDESHKNYNQNYPWHPQETDSVQAIP